MTKKEKLAKQARALARSRAAEAMKAAAAGNTTGLSEGLASLSVELTRVRAEPARWEAEEKKQERETKQFRRGAVADVHINPDDHNRRFACGRAIPHFDSGDNFVVQTTGLDDENLADTRDVYRVDPLYFFAPEVRHMFEVNNEPDYTTPLNRSDYRRYGASFKRGIVTWRTRGSKPCVITKDCIVRQRFSHGRTKSVRVTGKWRPDFDGIDLHAHVQQCLA